MGFQKVKLPYLDFIEIFFPFSDWVGRPVGISYVLTSRGNYSNPSSVEVPCFLFRIRLKHLPFSVSSRLHATRDRAGSAQRPGFFLYPESRPRHFLTFLICLPGLKAQVNKSNPEPLTGPGFSKISIYTCYIAFRMRRLIYGHMIVGYAKFIV